LLGAIPFYILWTRNSSKARHKLEAFMDCQLTFKKAFGLKAMPEEEFYWLCELQSSTFRVKSRDKLFHVSVGRMGETEQEKLALMPFLWFEERQPELIKPIPTLNFTIKLDLEIPASVYASWRIPSAGDSLVEPFIESAFDAYQDFAEAYRDSKYLTNRRTQGWQERHSIFVRMPAWNDFKTLLFYVLNVPNAVTFVGSFSIGRIFGLQPNDTALYQRIQETLNKGVPLSRLLVINAWEALFAGDLRSSIIAAATALELIVSQLVTADLKRRKVSSTEIKKLLKKDKGYLAAMVLDLFNLGDSPLKKQSADLFTIRNALVHRRRRKVSKEEATFAVETTEAFLLLAEGSSFELI
jgi:hypothetical protein